MKDVKQSELLFQLLETGHRSKDEPAKKFNLLKEKLRLRGFRFGKAVRREGTFIYRPISTRQAYTGTERVALLGEAAGWISPSSAEGLSYAFRSALILADILRKDPDGFGESYRRQTRKMRLNILLKNLKSRPR